MMKKGISCLIRKSICRETPEECVRQYLLKILIDNRGFPSSLCSVEIALKSLVDLFNTTHTNSEERHISSRLSSSALKRRIDILFFRRDEQKNNHGISPFILFECKARNKKLDLENTLRENISGDSTKKAIDEYSHLLQTIGYVHQIQVPYFAIVRGSLATLYYNGVVIYAGLVETFPSWEELEYYYTNKKWSLSL